MHKKLFRKTTPQICPKTPKNNLLLKKAGMALIKFVSKIDLGVLYDLVHKPFSRIIIVPCCTCIRVFKSMKVDPGFRFVGLCSHSNVVKRNLEYGHCY